LGRGHRELSEYLLSKDAKVTPNMLYDACKRMGDAVELVRAIVEASGVQEVGNITEKVNERHERGR
jgi:hypothetical protein